MKKMQKRKTVGLALGSGAIRGLAHVGVIKTLLKHNIPIDYLAGTSVGAWIAAFYAIHQDCEALEERTVRSKKEKLRALFDIQLKGGVIRGRKMEELLYQWLGEVTFEELEIPTSVVATDLLSAKEIVFSTGPVVPAVRASMAIPAMFQPVEYKNMLLVDGGVVNPVPDDVVKRMGADVVISVNLDSQMKNNKFLDKEFTARNTILRCIDILRLQLEEQAVPVADVVIEPKIDLFWFKAWKDYFTDDSVENLVHIGEQACEEKIPEIKKLLNRA